MVGEGNIAIDCWVEKENINTAGRQDYGFVRYNKWVEYFPLLGSGESINLKHKSSVKTRLSSIFRH